VYNFTLPSKGVLQLATSVVTALARE